jgi:hypothetical protein
MAGSLEFIKSTTGTSVGTLDVTDCFNANYDVYKIVISKLDNDVIGRTRYRYIDSGGSVISDAEYDENVLYMISYGSYAEYKTTGGTSLPNIAYQSTNATDGVGIVSYIFNPYDSSSFTQNISQSSGFYDVPGGGLVGIKQIGVHRVEEQITGLHIFPQTTSTNFDNITVNVFGVK